MYYFFSKSLAAWHLSAWGGGGDGATNPGQESEQPRGNPSLLEPHATARAPPSVPGVQDHPPPPEIYSPKAMFDGAQVL